MPPARLPVGLPSTLPGPRADADETTAIGLAAAGSGPVLSGPDRSAVSGLRDREKIVKKPFAHKKVLYKTFLFCDLKASLIFLRFLQVCVSHRVRFVLISKSLL